MNTNEEYSLEAQIERYLLGEMEKEELKAFKERINQDPDLQKEIEAYSLLFEQLDNLRLQEKVKRAIANNDNQAKKFFNIPLSVWLVAATLLLGTGAVMYKLFLTPQEPKIVLIKPDKDSSSLQTTRHLGLVENIPNSSDTMSKTNGLSANPNEPVKQTTTPSLSYRPPKTPKQKTTATISPTPTRQTEEPLTESESLAVNLPTTKLPTEEESNLYTRAANSGATQYVDRYYMLPKIIAKSVSRWQEEYEAYSRLNPSTIDKSVVFDLLVQLHDEVDACRNQFIELSKQDPNNLAIKYYIAHAYLIRNEAATAQSYLQDVANSNQTYSFTPYAQFFLALCYLDQNRQNDAIPILCSLNQQEETPIQIDRNSYQILKSALNINCR